MTGKVTWVEDFTFTMDGPGKVPDRQDTPHPHQALWHPSGKFVVVPDLGADILRIFTPNEDNTKLTEGEPVPVPEGTGPRHGAFYPPEDPKFYYVVGELSNTVTAYSVETGGEKPKFTQTQVISTLPEKYPEPKVAAAGEIVLAPSGKHIYVSNRLDTVFDGTSSIASYTVDPVKGKLELISIFDGHVDNIRHLNIHPSGEWLVTAGQDSGNIKTFSLDPETGKAGEESVGTLEYEKPVCVQWL